jgi:hypothetical protein
MARDALRNTDRRGFLCTSFGFATACLAGIRAIPGEGYRAGKVRLVLVKGWILRDDDQVA